jgi:NAD(P)-dependent dehydrogenase (short-subunit alcohol dehydrogenase family)
MVADSLSLGGKIAIVTGSGRENGIGAAIAKALARNGASVTINYVSPTTASCAEAFAASIKAQGGKAIVVQADVTSPDGAKKLVDETLKGFGVDHIDILGTVLVYRNSWFLK